MNVEVISTGTELMRGQSVDTNLAHIARQLLPMGLEVRYHSTYGDVLEDLSGGIRSALRRAQVVILTGGLGPTEDDMTREAAAKALQRTLVFHAEEFSRIRARFGRLRVPMARINRRQAYLPAGAQIVPNPRGSAPGFICTSAGKFFVALPGVPSEMEIMLEQTVLPALAARYRPEKDFEIRTFRVFGLPEGTVDEALLRMVRRHRGLEYGITVRGGMVTFSFKASGHEGERILNRLSEVARRRFGSALLGDGNTTLEGEVARLLREGDTSIALAESCTGGEVASRLTDISGISKALLEALVVYSNPSKSKRLLVPQGLIQSTGAVSKEVACAMAEGVVRTSGATIGAATTGVAGPTGGTSEKPVGLVFIAVHGRGKTEVRRFSFPPERLTVKDRAASWTLNMLRLKLLQWRNER